MGHSKASLLEDIKVKGGQMMATMIAEDVAIKPDYLSLPEEAAKLKMPMIRAGWKWLTAIYDDEYAEVRRLKSLLPDEIWARYKSWGGFEDHREVVLLKEALVALRKRLISREKPDIFKKSKCEKAIKARDKAKAAKRKSRRIKSQSHGTDSHN